MVAVMTVETLQISERDRRCANNMDPETREVHARLEGWARWACGEEIRAWPAVTLLGRVIEQGASGAGQSGRPPISMPDHIAHVDAAVAKLGAVDKLVIRIYYGPPDPVEAMARKAQMRVRQFQSVLRRARWRISGYLAAME